MRTRVEGTDAVIEVADNGPGVPAAERERIFDPFVTTKSPGEGTGLGLFVTRNIVRGLGGRVTLGDQPGGGALFRVVVPTTASKATADPDPTDRPPRAMAARVLIIDDDRQIAGLFRSQLEAAGYRVTIEDDGGRALEALAAAEASFELVFCDLMMTGVTGMDLADGLTRRAPAALDKIVFMTGGAFTPGAQAFRARHTDRVVDKPFDVVAEAAARLGAHAAPEA